MGTLDKTTVQVNRAINDEYDGDPSFTIGWDDLKFPATTVRVGATTKPDFDTTEIGLLFPQNDPSEIAYMIGQFTHSRKNGSDIEPHVHFIQTSVLVPVFKIDYRWYKNGDTPPAWTTLTSSDIKLPYTSGSILQIVDFPMIDGSAIDTVSSVVDVKLYRDDNIITGDVLVKEFDFHYQIDQPRGSRQEYIK